MNGADVFVSPVSAGSVCLGVRSKWSFIIIFSVADPIRVPGSREYDLMGEERYPFQSGGPVLPGAADQAMSAVFQLDELSAAKP